MSLPVAPLNSASKFGPGCDRYNRSPGPVGPRTSTTERWIPYMSLAADRARKEGDAIADPMRRSLNRQPEGPGKREVDLYVRTYTTLLESSGAIGVSSLEPAHLTAAPSLHAGAEEPSPD